jgi:DNA-directed RNA polymerase specialized sigma24 family protein
LCKIDVRKGKLVELRCFGGLTVEESAEILKISPETAKRDWRMAKAWLRVHLNGQNTFEQ